MVLIEAHRRFDELRSLISLIGNPETLYERKHDQPNLEVLPGNVKDYCRRLWDLLDGGTPVGQLWQISNLDDFSIYVTLSELKRTQQIAITVLPALTRGRVVAQQLHGHREQIVEVDGVIRLQPALVFRVRPGHGHVLAGGLGHGLFWRHERGFPGADGRSCFLALIAVAPEGEPRKRPAASPLPREDSEELKQCRIPQTSPSARGFANCVSGRACRNRLWPSESG